MKLRIAVLIGFIYLILCVMLFDIVNTNYQSINLKIVIYNIPFVLTLICLLITYTYTKNSNFGDTFIFSITVVISFILGIIPGFLIGNAIISIFINIKMDKDDMGAGILLMLTLIEFISSIIISVIINFVIKLIKSYISKHKCNSI